MQHLIIKKLTELGSPKIAEVPMYIYDELESTNDYLLELSSLTSLPDGVVVIARKQLAGRAKGNSKWYCGDENLNFSCFWNVSLDADLSFISLVVALALLKALNKIGLLNCKIKPPNDIYVDLRKLAGILIESRYKVKSRLAQLVIGIGVNIRGSASVAEKLGRPITDLEQELGNNVDIVDLISYLIIELHKAMFSFIDLGASVFEEELKLNSV